MLHATRARELRPITNVAEELGIEPSELCTYGPYKAKVSLSLMERLRRRNAKYIAVSAITPTPLGEGKTVHTIGLSLALNQLGHRAICTLRQPSMGPVFGIKGGATGGGRSQVVPSEEINLHLTGDFHAVGAAHNLLAAALDASLYNSNPLEIEPETVSWLRVLDINDRALRRVRLNAGGEKDGAERMGGFDITAASEVMSMLTLSSGRADLRSRLGRTVVAEDRAGRPVTAEALGCAGAMAAILNQAIEPTLLQTSEGTPALMHSGPFANIGPGNSSILADEIALRLTDYVVTESGFAADLGLEKLFNLKARASGIAPDAVVLVATVRALKVHSGRFQIVPGEPLDPSLDEEDLASLSIGLSNLEKQIEIARLHGLPVVCAINLFGRESAREIDLIAERARAAGARAAVTSEVFARGGEGGLELARAVVEAAAERSSFRHLYDLKLPLRKKIETLATSIYGAAEVCYSDRASARLDRLEAQGFGGLPICMAKTHLSISHEARQKGAPKGYVFPIQDVRLMAGAGFVTALAGSILTMPGMGKEPGFRRIDVDAQGRIQGLSG
jgi:formate--tetrahydrofolate ligase